MTQDEWSPRKNVVNIAIAVDIVQVWSTTAFDEQRLSTHGAEGSHRRINPAREHSLGLLEKFLRFLDDHDRSI
jgi:hypothetical protein